jgi:hypothetical protein
MLSVSIQALGVVHGTLASNHARFGSVVKVGWWQKAGLRNKKRISVAFNTFPNVEQGLAEDSEETMKK